MLQIEELQINFEHTTIGPINLSIEDEQIVSVIGTSGAGKSTLIKAIANVIEYNGKITYNDLQISKSMYTYITQNGSLFNHLTIAENLALTVDITNIDEVLESLNISSERKNSYPFELSGGERQRIDIARAILAKVSLVILDEAFNALDTKTKDDIYDVIKEIQVKYKMLILLVTHDLQEAVTLSNQILIVDDGQITFNGTPEKLVSEDNVSVSKLVNDNRLKLLRGLYANIN